jgi:hypothetical protein
MRRCAQSSRSNVAPEYASARRSIARLASEIFLSSLPRVFARPAGEFIDAKKESDRVMDVKNIDELFSPAYSKMS